MVQPSRPMAVGAGAVCFRGLPGVDGRRHDLSSLSGRIATAVVFVGNGCPTVRAYEDRLTALERDAGPQGVHVIAVNPNNPYLSPPDTMVEMVRRASERGYNFPYLKDLDGAVARAYGAICTPHAFVLDAGLRIVYSGRIDDSRVGDRISKREFYDAVADVVAGRPVATPRTDPFGCAIVW